MKKLGLTTLILMLVVPFVFAEDLDPKKLLNEANSFYKDLQSYSSNVTVVYDTTISGRPHKSTTQGSFKLLKPNLYYVQWLSKSGSEGMEMTSKGVIWNSGNGDYMYTGYSYNKEQSDEMNFGAGAGISSTVTHIIPSLFFQKKGDILTVISDTAKVTGSETINGEDCYVLQGSASYSPKITVWISKSRKALVKLDQVLDTQNTGAIPEYTEEQMKESLKAMGQESTPENIAGFKKMMAFSREKMKDVDIKGSLSETFEDIQINPVIEKASLEYKVPGGMALQENPYKDLLDPKKIEELEKLDKKIAP